jgi:hypothetical protein
LMVFRGSETHIQVSVSLSLILFDKVRESGGR